MGRGAGPDLAFQAMLRARNAVARVRCTAHGRAPNHSLVDELRHTPGVHRLEQQHRLDVRDLLAYRSPDLDAIYPELVASADGSITAADVEKRRQARMP